MVTWSSLRGTNVLDSVSEQVDVHRHRRVGTQLSISVHTGLESRQFSEKMLILKSLGLLLKSTPAILILYISKLGKGNRETPAFDSRCGRPLPTGWAGVSIMYPAETKLMVCPLCLVICSM